jgi:hypothetical protein
MPDKMCPLAYSDGIPRQCELAKCAIFVEAEAGSGQGQCALLGLASLPDIAKRIDSVDNTIRVRR